MPPALAWDEHTAWLGEQEAARQHGDASLDADGLARARELAGPRPRG